MKTIWGQIVNALVGIWLMASPAVLGYGDPAQFNDRIAGPLAATFAIIAWWEATRPCRRVNLVVGIWLLAAPFVLGYHETSALLNSLASGVLLAALSFTGGEVKQKFGGGWRSLWPPRKVAQGQEDVYGSGADWSR